MLVGKDDVIAYCATKQTASTSHSLYNISQIKYSESNDKKTYRFENSFDFGATQILAI